MISVNLNAQIVGPYTGIDYATAYTNPSVGGACGSIAAINAAIGDADFVNGAAEVPLGWSFSGTWASGASYMDGPGIEVLLVSLHTYTETWSVALRLSNGTTTAFAPYALTIVTSNANGSLAACGGIIPGPFNYERPSQELDFASYAIPAGVGVIGIVFEPLTDGAVNPDPHGVIVLQNTPILAVGSTMDSTPACFGACNGTASVVDGPDVPYTYQWDAAAGNVVTQSATNLCPGNYSVDITGFSGAVETLNVVVGEDPQLTLNEVSSTPFICDGGNGQLEVIGGGGSPGYLYSIDNITFGPGAIFNGLSGGTHTITVQDMNMCTETLDIVIVEGAPIVVNETVNDEICLGDCQGSIDLSAAGDMPFSYSIDNCASNFAAGNFANLCAGDYTICIEDANGCQYTSMATVADGAGAGMDVTMNPIGPFCVNDNPVAITSANLGTLSGPGVVNGSFNPANAGAGTHTILNEVTNACYYSATMDVIVHTLPVVSLTSDVADGCEALTVNFANTGDAGVNCLWTFGDNSSSSVCDFATHTYANDGTYNVSLTVTDANGCSGTRTYPNFIVVHPLPVANFISTGVEGNSLDPVVNFKNTSSGEISWNWNFDGLGSSSLENTSFTFPNVATSYLVTLIVGSEFGCYDTIISPVTILPTELIYIPNTFTPDDDEFNQNFQPIFTEGFDPYDYNILIYNRWGEVIFESNDALFGWDGTYGGQKVQSGLYNWKIEFKTITNDERKVLVGHVNVMR